MTRFQPRTGWRRHRPQVALRNGDQARTEEQGRTAVYQLWCSSTKIRSSYISTRTLREMLTVRRERQPALQRHAQPAVLRQGEIADYNSYSKYYIGGYCCLE